MATTVHCQSAYSGLPPGCAVPMPMSAAPGSTYYPQTSGGIPQGVMITVSCTLWWSFLVALPCDSFQQADQFFQHAAACHGFRSSFKVRVHAEWLLDIVTLHSHLVWHFLPFNSRADHPRSYLFTTGKPSLYTKQHQWHTARMSHVQCRV